MMSSEGEYWKQVLTIVPIVGAALATLIYLLRLYSRRLAGAGIEIEDAVMGIGLLIPYAATSFVVYTAFNGVGKPTKSLPLPEQNRLRFGSWMIQKFWAPSLAFVKISIIMFLRRIMGSLRIFRIIANSLIVFIILWALSALLVNIFQCWPVSYYYDQSQNGHCIQNQDAFFQTMGSLSLVVDVCILCLPIPFVWHLQINLQRKIAFTGIFSLGGLVCIFSLLRLVQFRYFVTSNLASSSALESIWTTLEIDMAIICGCLPILVTLVQGCSGKGPSTAPKSAPSSSSAGRIYVRSSSGTTNNGFQKIVDPSAQLHTLTTRATVDSSAENLDDDSEIEMQGIAVPTSISQAVSR